MCCAAASQGGEDACAWAARAEARVAREWAGVLGPGSGRAGRSMRCWIERWRQCEVAVGRWLAGWAGVGAWWLSVPSLWSLWGTMAGNIVNVTNVTDNF